MTYIVSSGTLNPTILYCCQLLSSVAASSLRLTKIDSELYSSFRCQFPQLDINQLDVELIKSAEGKEVATFGYYAVYVLC